MYNYRYPTERIILAVTLLILLAFLALTAGITLCLAPLVVGIFLFLAYQSSRAHHRALLSQAIPISRQSTPALATLADETARRLQLDPQQLDFFIVRSRQRNAYTFGLSDPKVVVIYSALLEIMSPAEMRFIVGHELGHVALGHTWLNSLLGGMAGIPTSLEAVLVLTLAFRSWNRACEFSADRAGLLACGNLQTAISALVKLVAGDVRSREQFERALALIDQEDDSPLNLLGETLSTHPMLIRRITELKRFAASAAYQQTLQS